MSTLKNFNSIDLQSSPNSVRRFGIDLVKTNDQKLGLKSRNALRESVPRNLSLFNELMLQTNIKMNKPKKKWFMHMKEFFKRKKNKKTKKSLLKSLKMKIASGFKKPAHNEREQTKEFSRYNLFSQKIYSKNKNFYSFEKNLCFKRFSFQYNRRQSKLL